MSDENQILIPPSFEAVHRDARGRLLLPRETFRARYELCEDLANLLTEKAANMQFTLGITEELVLTQCELGLLAEPAVVSPVEARWVVCRLGELLNWPIDQLLQSPPTADPVV